MMKIKNNCLIIFFISFLVPFQILAVENDLENGIKVISEKVQTSISQAKLPQPLRILILPIKWDKENQWELCRITTELLKNQIASIGSISFIEKMAGININIQKGLLESDKIAELGLKLNCDIIITGYLNDLNTVVNINLFLWNTANRSLISMESVQIRKTASIVSLLTSPYDEQSEHHNYYSAKWRGKPLSYKILAMSIGDIDGDKVSEIVLLSEDEIKILSWNGFGFVERFNTKYTNILYLQRNQKDMRTLFVLDSDNDGCDEIFISIPDKETTVWKLEKDSLIKIQALPSTLLSNQNNSMIFGSLKQSKNYFSGQGTYEISKTNNSRVDRILPIDYYSIGIGDVNNNEGKEWILIDTGSIMNVYTDNIELLWKSTMNFGLGIIIADLDKNNINEIITTSAIPQGKEDYLIILEWDGNTYTKKWESKTINGSITSICVGDPNNDGVDELIIAIFNQGKSEILFYTANYIYNR